MKFLSYIFIFILSTSYFGQTSKSPVSDNDTVHASYKGGNKAYTEQIKVNYIDFNKPEKGKQYKVYVEIVLPERSLSCPEARISNVISKDLTEDNKIWLCNALAAGCDNWIYKTYKGKRIQTNLYYEVILSAENVKVKSIKYKANLGWFMHYSDDVDERTGS